MRFEFGCAGRLYEERLHPRVLLGPEDIPALRARARDGDGAVILAAMRQKARLFSRQVLDADDLVEKLRAAVVFWPKPGHEYLWALPDMTLIGP